MRILIRKGIGGEIIYGLRDKRGAACMRVALVIACLIHFAPLLVFKIVSYPIDTTNEGEINALAIVWEVERLENKLEEKKFITPWPIEVHRKLFGEGYPYD